MDLMDSQSRILHYRLIGKIGSGGMGAVYRAEDTKLGRTVAIKVLHHAANENPVARQRFLKEAQSASALNHPNIVTIYAIEESESFDFIVMEYVDGRTLKSLIEHDGALPLATLLDIGIQIAGALEAAHAVGLLHRDIKSANILLSPRGHAKVLDFGLAKTVSTLANAVDAEAPTLMNLTDEGTVLGTAAYMSPEQTRAERLDARSDIFSLGCVLYEVATRLLPFGGPSMLAVMHEIAATAPVTPSRLRPELPAEFDAIIERALAKDKDRRYQSARELGDALQTLRATLTGQWFGMPIVFDKDLLESPSLAFVGREAELEKLERFVQQAIEGNGRVVFITGEPGIGKTSLSDEFLHAREQRIRDCSLPADAASNNTAPGRRTCRFSMQ